MSPTDHSRAQRIASRLNHLSWAAIGLCVIGGVIAERLGAGGWETTAGAIVNGSGAVLFVIAFLAAFCACGAGVVYPRVVLARTRAESFLALAFIVVLLLTFLLVPGFISALDHFSRNG